MLGSYHIFESTIGTNFHMKKRISLIISFFFKILYLDQYLDYHQNANRHFSSRLILTQTRFSPKILSKVDWSINHKVTWNNTCMFDILMVLDPNGFKVKTINMCKV